MATTIYSALITGAPDALPDWSLTLKQIEIDMTVTGGRVQVHCMVESDYTEALLRPNGSMKVFESIDGAPATELISVPMEAANRQDFRKTISDTRGTIDVVLRAQGTVTPTPLVNEDVSNSARLSQSFPEERLQRVKHSSALTPGSTVKESPDRTITVDQTRTFISNQRSDVHSVYSQNGAP